jgi:hypothetical protein
MKAGGESRLSLEGLTGVTFHGKVIRAIYAHAQRRRMRTVRYSDGSQEDMPIWVLVDALIKSKSE